MRLIKISECCNIISGSTPSRGEPSFWNGEINWFTPKDLSNLTSKYVYESPEKISEKGFRSCSANLLPVNSLLFTSRAPIGHVAINKQTACTNQGFKSLVPIDKKVHIDYLYYVIKRMVPMLQDLGNGATFKELSKSTLSRVQIPLPPLPIQQKIAQVLDRADALRQRNRQIIHHYDQLAQSVFLEMFSHAEGKLVNLEEVVKIQNGQVDPNVEPYSEMIHVGGANIESGTGNLINLKSAKEGMLISGKYLFTEDHVLYSKIRPYLNKVSKPGFTGICSADIYPIKPNSSLTKEYLMFLLRSIAFLNYANNNSGRANIPKINRKDLLKFEFQLPSFKKQSQFTEIMNNIEAQKQQQQQALAKSEELFQSLLQRAFKGELLAEAKTNPQMEMF